MKTVLVPYVGQSEYLIKIVKDQVLLLRSLSASSSRIVSVGEIETDELATGRVLVADDFEAESIPIWRSLFLVRRLSILAESSLTDCSRELYFSESDLYSVRFQCCVTVSSQKQVA